MLKLFPFSKLSDVLMQSASHIIFACRTLALVRQARAAKATKSKAKVFFMFNISFRL